MTLRARPITPKGAHAARGARHARRFLCNVRGSIAVEAAITLPVFAALALGGIDFIQQAQSRQAVTSLAAGACAAGAKAGYDYPSNRIILDTAQDAANQYFTANKGSAFAFATPATLTVTALPADPNHFIVCVVSATVTPIVGFITKDSKTFTATVTD